MARCKTCPILLTTDEFCSHTTREKFKVEVRASCKCSSVIYLITCSMWGLNCRMSNRHYNIMHQTTKDSPVEEHFNDVVHSQVDMVVMVVDVK